MNNAQSETFGSAGDRLSPAEFRERFRVSLGTLPNGNKIEVLAVKITNDNWQMIPSMRRVRSYLIDLYGQKVSFLSETMRTDGDVLVFEYTE